MSSPPHTPTQTRHRRHPSSLDFNSYQSSPRYSFSRRSSAAAYSPVTPRSSHGFAMHSSPGGDFPEVVGEGNGLGNLADELADVWSEDEEEQEEFAVDSSIVAQMERNGELGGSVFANGSTRADAEGEGEGSAGRDSGIVLESSPIPPKTNGASSRSSSQRHRRKPESLYDGSEYGSESDLETSEGISAGLEARMAVVESLARRGVEENGSESDRVVARVTERLRDLGSQSGVEGGAARLTTAHTALTTHLTHQTRTLSSLTSTLLSPLAPPPPLEFIDLLLPLLSSTLETLPHPTPAPLFAIHALAASTADLSSTLSYLSDSLHVSRSTSITAQRRLRVVTEAMAEWKRESEGAEMGMRWIEQERWQERLAERECAKTCRDVVGGFEEVCEKWRERLVQGAKEVEAVS